MGGRFVKVEQKRQGKVLILYVSERLDNLNAHELVKTMTQVIESGEQNLLINFEQLTYLSSSGLRVLLGGAKRMETKGGKFMVCSPQKMVKRVIQLVGFDKVLSVYDSEAEALQHF